MLIKNFKGFAQGLSDRVKKLAYDRFQQAGRPNIYLPSSELSKEALVQDLVAKEQIKEGPIVLLSCVEPCLTFRVKPDEPGYDEARSIWNAMIDRRPALIARCLGVADVARCVDFARLGQGGGHNISGLAVCDGGLILDMSLMRGVWVDPVTRTARVRVGRPCGDSRQVAPMSISLQKRKAPSAFTRPTG